MRHSYHDITYRFASTADAIKMGLFLDTTADYGRANIRSATFCTIKDASRPGHLFPKFTFQAGSGGLPLVPGSSPQFVNSTYFRARFFLPKDITINSTAAALLSPECGSGANGVSLTPMQ